MRLPIENIEIGTRLRAVTAATAQALAISIDEVGLQQAITARPIGFKGDLPAVKLVIGAHRLAAAKLLGWTHIDVAVREMTDAEARLAEADENLIRGGLSAHERALFIQARLSAWAERFPERAKANEAGKLQPKRGRPANSEKFAEFSTGMGFSQETAEAVDLSEKSIRNALVIARGLSDEAHAALQGTSVARNEGLLRQLAGVGDPTEQLAITQQLLGGVKSFSDARALAAGNQPMAAVQSPVDDTLNALRKLWKAAPATHRTAMLDWLAGQKLPAGWAVERTDG